MRRLEAIGLALALGATWAGPGCGTRLGGRVARDGGAPVVDVSTDLRPEAGMEAGTDAGADAAPDVGADAAPDVAADAAPDVGPDGPPLPPTDLPPVCTIDGWCWTHPLPTGDQLVDAVKVGADDVWLIGAAGTIVRFAGGKLSTIPPPSSTLAAVWVTDAGDVWAGGTAGQYRWDGQRWTQVGITTAPNQRGVDAFWGCAPGDIWAMGPIATRWDGQSWLSVKVPSDVLLTEGNFRAVWGSACDDVWTGSLLDSAGTGAIYHFDGGVWSKVEQRAAEQLAGIGRSDVWSLAQGRLFHSNGVDAGVLARDHIVSLSPVGADHVGVMSDARVVSLLGSGGASTSLAAPAPAAASTLRGWAPGDLWALGGMGTAAHWNGASWESHLPAWSLSAEDATRVTGSGPADVWAVVGGALLRGDGASWRVALTPADVGGQVVDLWAPGPGEVWVVGGDNLLHKLGVGGWTTENPLAGDGTMPKMRAISGTGPRDVWIVRGTNSVLHWDGDSWIARDVLLYYGGGANAVNAIWAAAPNDLWAVGDGISHWANGSWVAPPRFPSDVVGISGPYIAVAGTGPDDVHFLLASGYVVKATSGLSLVEELSALTHPLTLVAAASVGVWAMFDDAASGVSRLYRVGSDPDAGVGWSATVVAPAGLNGIWSAPDGTLWAAGKGGSLLRRAPTP